MLLGIARRGRQHSRAHALDSIMDAEAACEKSVAVGDAEHVVTGDAISGEATCHTFAPYLDILAGITDDGRVAGGSRGCMETDDFAHRGRLQTGGIIVPEVLLGSERELDDIVDGGDVLRGEVHLLQLVTIERDVVVNIVHDLVQAFALELAHLLAGH